MRRDNFSKRKRNGITRVIIVQILLYKTYVRVMNILLASPQGTQLSVISIGRVSLQFPCTGRHPSGAAISCNIPCIRDKLGIRNKLNALKTLHRN